MHALGTLYERSGNWPFSLEMLQREAQVIGPSPEAADLHHRMGKINEDMLQDVQTAKACYLEALRILPSYLPSIGALRAFIKRKATGSRSRRPWLTKRSSPRTPRP